MCRITQFTCLPANRVYKFTCTHSLIAEQLLRSGVNLRKREMPFVVRSVGDFCSLEKIGMFREHDFPLPLPDGCSLRCVTMVR